MSKKKLEAKLVAIQQTLNAPKGQTNAFGKYRYRSCEDILEALKTPLGVENCGIVLSDEIIMVGDRIYVEASATLIDGDGDDPITMKALAREPQMKKGMDDAQLTGATSSYARKYALNGLFAIDDCKDADTMDNRAAGQATAAPATDAEPEHYESHHEENKIEVKPDDYTTEQFYTWIQSSLSRFCEERGFKKSAVNGFIKSKFDGRTISQMKNDRELLESVWNTVSNDYRPEVGESIGGSIPGIVVE